MHTIPPTLIRSLAHERRLGSPPQAAPTLPVVESTYLLQGHSEVLIAHQGQHYRLRLTSLGKLILTK